MFLECLNAITGEFRFMLLLTSDFLILSKYICLVNRNDYSTWIL